MAKGQKEAVVDLVKRELGAAFVPGVTLALGALTTDQLSRIKSDVAAGIMAGAISYGKPLVAAEVKAYASSMVMNHLKKAKELNGGSKYTPNSTSVEKVKTSSTVSTSNSLEKLGINASVLPSHMKDSLESLISNTAS